QLGQLGYRLFRRVEYHALMASFKKPSHHVCTHSAEPNDSNLHKLLLVQRTFASSFFDFRSLGSPSQFRLDLLGVGCVESALNRPVQHLVELSGGLLSR